MASWLERGRPALLEALNSVCDTIDADLRAELRAADQLRQQRAAQELASLKERVAQVEALEEENRQLQATVSRLQRKSPSTTATSTSTSRHDTPRHASNPPAETESNAGGTKQSKDAQNKFSLENLKSNPSDTREKLTEKNYILVRKFQALDENFKKLTAKYVEKQAKLKGKDSTIAKLRKELLALKETKLPAETVGEEDTALPPLIHRPRASSHGPPNSSGNDPAAALSFSSDPGPDVAGEEGNFVPPALSGAGSQRAAIPPSEASTVVSDPAEAIDTAELPPLPRARVEDAAITIKAEPSSDVPVLVAERCVRKRKAADDAVDAPTPKRHIKSEDEDSEPAEAIRSVTLVDQDSLDLDEVGPRFSTPRKLRLWADNPASAPGAVTRRLVLNEASRSKQLKTPTAFATRPAIESSALAPINANIRIRKPVVAGPKSVDRPLKSGLSEGIRSLAEDGNLYQRAVRRKTNNALQETPVAGGRLGRLLNPSGGGSEPAILRSAPALRHADRSTPDLPPRRELPFGRKERGNPSDQTPSRTSKAADRAVSAKSRMEAPGQASRKGVTAHGTLRLKDVSELRPEDFKINPKANDGADFAYSEVVRGKEDRACLPGCTDMQCCGPMFRALAMIELKKRTPAEDMKLFEEYLGDSISRIWSMSREEKDELWLEAKTWHIAKTQGKHKHRHARRASPPGFWDTGFPDTQEIQQEKEEARRRERRAVQERYREAMRSGGRWLFRDE